MSLLAYALKEEGRFTKSEKLFRKTIEIQRRVLGPEHPDTLLSMSNLVSTLEGENDYGEAERLSRDALQIQRRVLGPEHPDTRSTRNPHPRRCPSGLTRADLTSAVPTGSWRYMLGSLRRIIWA